MKLLGIVGLLSALLVQMACVPKTTVYKADNAYANTGSVPSWVDRLDPHTKLVHFAKNNNSTVIANFLRNNSTDFKPLYISMALGHAVKRGDKAIMQQILTLTGKNKAQYATIAMGKAGSKSVMDFLISQGGAINGIAGKVNIKNTVSILAKNGPLMHMGNEYNPVTARLLVEAGADPLKEFTRGQTVISNLERMADEYAKHAILKKKHDDLVNIIAYLKTAEQLTDVERLVLNGDLRELKSRLNKTNINHRNKRGLSLLHLAARSDQYDIAKYLVAKNSRLLTVKNKAGETPLDLIKSSKNRLAKYLSCKQNRACSSVAGFERQIKSGCSNVVNMVKCRSVISNDIHGVFTTHEVSKLIAKSEYESACKVFNYKKCQSYVNRFSDSEYAEAAQNALENYKNKQAKLLYQKSCGNKGSLKKCKTLERRYPGMFPQEEISSAIAFHSQKCRLKETGWIYIGNQCKSGMAHGQGKAINTAKKLSFKGRFSKGQRVSGIISFNGTEMYDGLLKSGKPDGKGICFHESEPEECKYYRGKRVDVIYKQRMENLKQERRMDEKLAEMRRMQDQQNKKISQIQNDVRSGRHAAQVSGKTVGQEIGDYAIKKAGEKVMDKLFDKLF